MQRCGKQIDFALRLARYAAQERAGKIAAALRRAGVEDPHGTMRAFPAQLLGGQRQVHFVGTMEFSMPPTFGEGTKITVSD